MITPNPKAHMSPRDLMRALAAEAETLPGWSLNDRSFHASYEVNPLRVTQFDRVNQSVKAFYLKHGHTAEQWQALSPQQFNRTWRQMLGLLLDDAPPPLAMRHVLP